MMLYAAGSVCDISVEGPRLCGLTWMDQMLWYSDSKLEQIVGVDPETGAVKRRISCPGVRTGLTTLHGHLLQVVGIQRSLRVIDAATGDPIKELENPRPGGLLCGIESSGTSIWLGYRSPRVLDLRQGASWRLQHSIELDDEAAGVTVPGGYVAVAIHEKAQICMLDPTTGQVAVTIGVYGKPTGLTWDGRRIWYCDFATSQLRAIEVPGIVTGPRLRRLPESRPGWGGGGSATSTA